MAGSQLKITTNGKAKKVTYSVFHNSWNCYYNAFFRSTCVMLAGKCEPANTQKEVSVVCHLVRVVRYFQCWLHCFAPIHQLAPTGTNWPAPSFTPAGSSSKDQAQRKKIAVHHLPCSWLSVPKTLCSKQDGNPLRQFT